TVTASGGTAPYSGTGTSTHIAGSYTFVVTDANGCTASTSITITQPTALSASRSSDLIACNGGTTTVTVTAAGGTAPYSGTGTSTHGAGSYTFVVTDANGCTASTSITITEPSILSAFSSAGTIACFGGTTTVTVTAAGGTLPHSGTGNFTRGAGTYTFTVTDTRGCTASTSITITQPPVLNCIITPPSVLPFCGVTGNTIGATTTGGTGTINYSWSVTSTSN